MPRIIPIRDFKNTSEIFKIRQEATEPIYTQNGYGDIVRYIFNWECVLVKKDLEWVSND